jgi:hypothetical protein
MTHQETQQAPELDANITCQPKLLNTLDRIQKRFWCDIIELTEWRNALIYRYSAIADPLFKLEVVDFNQEDEVLNRPGGKWIDKLPNDLAKTAIRLSWNGSKRITVTLYFKSASNEGTLLCQGKDCIRWNSEECEKLKHLVSDFVQSHDYGAFTATLLRVPLCFVQAYGDVSLVRPSLPTYPKENEELNQDTNSYSCHHGEKEDAVTPPSGSVTEPVSASSPTPEGPTPPPLLPDGSPSGACVGDNDAASPGAQLSADRADSAHLLLSCQFQPRTPVVLLAPTPLDNTAPSPGAFSAQSATRRKVYKTPTGTRAKQLRRRTLCVNKKLTPKPHIVHLPQSVISDFEQMRDNVDDLFVSQQDIRETLISVTEDTKASIKNDLKVSFKSKCDSINEQIDNIKEEMVAWSNTVDALRKEIQSLKTQLGNVRSQLKSVKAKASTNTCDFSNQVNDLCLPTVSKATDLMANNGPDVTVQTNELSNDSVLSDTHACVNNDCPESSKIISSCVATTCLYLDSETQGKTSDEVKKTDARCLGENYKSCRTNTDLDAALKAESEIPIDSLENSIESNYSIHVSNKFSPLSDQTREAIGIDEKKSSSPLEGSHDADHFDQSHQDRPVPRSPSDVLSQITVNDHATGLLIGDSVMRYVNTKRLAIRYYNVHKICIPGMTTTDLMHWLKHQCQYPKIKALVVHVGVNDCPSGPVSVNTWSDLAELCKQVFPNACIAFSSLVPAKGRSSINNAILPTNRNLLKACKSSDISLLDNTNAFVAKSGAPKLLMYHDSIHPSQKGVAQLAKNIKGIILGWVERDRASSFQPSYSERAGDREQWNGRGQAPASRGQRNAPSHDPCLADWTQPEYRHQDSRHTGSHPQNRHPIRNTNNFGEGVTYNDNVQNIRRTNMQNISQNQGNDFHQRRGNGGYTTEYTNLPAHYNDQHGVLSGPPPLESMVHFPGPPFHEKHNVPAPQLFVPRQIPHAELPFHNPRINTQRQDVGRFGYQQLLFQHEMNRYIQYMTARFLSLQQQGPGSTVINPPSNIV